MKNILFVISICLVVASCTKDLGTLSSISTKEIKLNQNYELALKQQSYTANSLENCINLALKSVPNSVFLKNVKVSSKGTKVSIIGDVWARSKKQPEKNSDLNLDKYKKPPKGQSSMSILNDKEKFKKGMKVTWSHPKAGEGVGVISKIYGNMASIEKVVDLDGKPGKPVRLPLSVLKALK